MNKKQNIAEILLPLALYGTYSYSIPPSLLDQAEIGKRVEVQFGKSRIYAGIIIQIEQKESDIPLKEIQSFLDEKPIVSAHHLKFWHWISEYYVCSLGTVMNNALPSALKLTSDTLIQLHENFDGEITHLNILDMAIVQRLLNGASLKVKEIHSELGIKQGNKIIQNLYDKHVITLREQLTARYKPKKKKYYRVPTAVRDNDKLLEKTLDELERAPKQSKALITLLSLPKDTIGLTAKSIQNKSDVSSHIVQTLVKRELVEVKEIAIDRLLVKNHIASPLTYTLSEEQNKCKLAVLGGWKKNQPVLLHGVTGSGKTLVYVDLIKDLTKDGGTVLILVPEIALTTQLIGKFRRYFSRAVGIYHSRFNDQERVEIWNKAKAGKYQVILGPRSTLFLPTENLKAIIVDEEHDGSYKQGDKAPFFQARDAAIVYASIMDAKVLLGTATPSLESFHNCKLQKYSYVRLAERYGQVALPVMELVDTYSDRKNGYMQGDFSKTIIDGIRGALQRNEQIIVFKNRRGYAPFVNCKTCNHTPTCYQCDVSLTYHKYNNNMVCHYCGYFEKFTNHCSHCHSDDIEVVGLGTEKIEDDLSILFPKAKISRLDFDTARTKTGYAKTIASFEAGKTNILVGTQMVTKGLDFPNVSLVVVIGLDQQIRYPEFRAVERAFQLLIQVSGRSGRLRGNGKVLIQTNIPLHAVYQMALNRDYNQFYQREIAERKTWIYPPVVRMIEIVISHKDASAAQQSANYLTQRLKYHLKEAVLGPTQPAISRVRGLYIYQILIKMRLDWNFAKVKHYITSSIEEEKVNLVVRQSRIKINVDP